MNTSKWIFWLGLIAAKLGLAIVFVLVVAEAYVRWTLNQNFNFLGGFELEALTLSAFALTIALLRAYRPGTN